MEIPLLEGRDVRRRRAGTGHRRARRRPARRRRPSSTRRSPAPTSTADRRSASASASRCGRSVRASIEIVGVVGDAAVRERCAIRCRPTVYVPAGNGAAPTLMIRTARRSGRARAGAAAHPREGAARRAHPPDRVADRARAPPAGSGAPARDTVAPSSPCGGAAARRRSASTASCTTPSSCSSGRSASAWRSAPAPRTVVRTRHRLAAWRRCRQVPPSVSAAGILFGRVLEGLLFRVATTDVSVAGGAAGRAGGRRRRRGAAASPARRAHRPGPDAARRIAVTLLRRPVL